ncbi:hypothetical protein B0H13DRAFT_2315137 [Mycena leptocephala]|nr:hypothetical protein B0H13DRAFT_2315137 [Mycena leptocephala]
MGRGMLGATDTEATRSVYHEIKGVVSALWIWPVLFEKMIFNLVALWSGKFKGLDTRDEDYEIPEEVWEEIWRETAGDIPSSFSRSLVPWAGIHRSPYIIPTCGFVPWMMSLVSLATGASGRPPVSRFDTAPVSKSHVCTLRRCPSTSRALAAALDALRLTPRRTAICHHCTRTPCHEFGLWAMCAASTRRQHLSLFRAKFGPPRLRRRGSSISFSPSFHSTFAVAGSLLPRRNRLGRAAVLGYYNSAGG